jgi:signal peptidase I
MVPGSDRSPTPLLGEDGDELRPEPAPEGPDGEDYDRYYTDDEADTDELVELRSKATRNALEWAVVLVGAVLVALLLRASLFQAFWIPSESMEATLEVNDRVLVNKLSYRLHDIHRGDVVVFERPNTRPGEIKDLIKRVIGLPGDTIEVRDNAVFVNSTRLIEPYLDEADEMEDYGPSVVPEGEIFVMGDNRDESQDSRAFGTVSQDQVVGRAFVLFWPVNRVGWL